VNPSSEEIKLLMSATTLRYPERIADISNKIQISVFIYFEDICKRNAVNAAYLR